jgi:hypothetical protein
MQNGIFSIRPYRWQNMWVFDDERVGLVKEPFVMGIPDMIDREVAHLPEAEKGFTILFNSTGLPGADVVLTKAEAESGGTWYEQKATGLKGWLCPALFKYFDEAPETIYVKVTA